MQMHTVWSYFEIAWEHRDIAEGFAIGFTAKDILSFTVRKYHMWREHVIDKKIVAYLLHEVEANPAVGPDQAGLYRHPYYRSSDQIADALHRKSVDVINRLERLQKEKRVEREAPALDSWTISGHEWHDSGRKPISPVTAHPP
jgi:hypothetical protein